MLPSTRLKKLKRFFTSGTRRYQLEFPKEAFEGLD